MGLSREEHHREPLAHRIRERLRLAPIDRDPPAPGRPRNVAATSTFAPGPSHVAQPRVQTQDLPTGNVLVDRAPERAKQDRVVEGLEQAEACVPVRAQKDPAEPEIQLKIGQIPGSRGRPVGRLASREIYGLGPRNFSEVHREVGRSASQTRPSASRGTPSSPPSSSLRSCQVAEYLRFDLQRVVAGAPAGPRAPGRPRPRWFRFR